MLSIVLARLIWFICSLMLIVTITMITIVIVVIVIIVITVITVIAIIIAVIVVASSDGTRACAWWLTPWPCSWPFCQPPSPPRGQLFARRLVESHLLLFWCLCVCMCISCLFIANCMLWCYLLFMLIYLRPTLHMSGEVVTTQRALCVK